MLRAACCVHVIVAEGETETETGTETVPGIGRVTNQESELRLRLLCGGIHVGPGCRWPAVNARHVSVSVRNVIFLSLYPVFGFIHIFINFTVEMF